MLCEKDNINCRGGMTEKAYRNFRQSWDNRRILTSSRTQGKFPQSKLHIYRFYFCINTAAH